MSFRNGAYAKVWDVDPQSEYRTKLRISTSGKDKDGNYYQDFSGFVMCSGSATAAKAAKLKKGDRIKLGEVATTTRWDAERRMNYINHSVFSFEVDNEHSSDGHSSSGRKKAAPEVDSGYDDDQEPEYPF